MASLVHSATDNKALLSVSGSVEAGFNMGQSKVERVGTTWVITLPKVALYQPHATARVFDEHSGMLWRDPNIGLDAEHLSASQFTEAALQGGIKDVARQEAVKRVTSLASQFTKDPIRVQFTS